jgi:type VI secretion system secreted protein VgrG
MQPVQQREMAISGPFPEGLLQVQSFSGREELGRPFEYVVSLLSASPDLDLSALVGDTVALTVELAPGRRRTFHGYVTRMALAGTFDDLARYQIVVRPWLFLLSARLNSRVFQHKSVLDIARALFAEHGFSDYEIAPQNLAGAYPEREFVVQYRESDLDFVSRLFEHEGLYYFFRHEQDRHVLVVADSLAAHRRAAGYEQVPFHPAGPQAPEAGEHLDRWQVAHEWRAGAYASGDYDFLRPADPVRARRHVRPRHRRGDLEIFDYPGGYTDAAGGDQFVLARLQALQGDVELAHAAGDVRGLGAGDLFALTDYPEPAQNKEYLVVQAGFEAANAAHATGEPAGPARFRSSFVVVDAKVPFRPRAATPVARVIGPQTAVVVGEAGEEITTDRYGRVRVQFRWDREGQFDQDSSCWVRVAQAWAGQGWGALHVPRVGQEVIVEFLDGDPDRPIITGRVYNAQNMPPWGLPENKTQSGIRSRSTPGGGPANYNEIRFEDKKGSEELHLQAERDLSALVKRDRRTEVGADDALAVGGDRAVVVNGNLSVAVKGGGKSPVHSNLDVTGKHQVRASDTVEIEAPTHVKLTCGDSSLLIEPGRITLTSGGRSSVVLDAGVAARSSQGSKLALDAGALVGASTGGSLAIEAGVEARSAGSSLLLLQDNGTITLDGNKIQALGRDKISLAAGGSFVEADPSGVSVGGAMVKLND